jgi:hypothetical protein
LVVTFSCGSSDDGNDTNSGIIGKWIPYKEYGYKYHQNGFIYLTTYSLPENSCESIDYVFIKDNSNIESKHGELHNNGSCEIHNKNFTYTISSDTKVLTIKESSGTEKVSNIVSLSSSELVLQSKGSPIITYYKRK